LTSKAYGCRSNCGLSNVETAKRADGLVAVLTGRRSLCLQQTLLYVPISMSMSRKRLPPSLNTAGLTVSDAFRMMLIRTVADKALPFDPLVPNAETIEAMEEARGGNLPRVNTVEELLEELDVAD